MGHDLAVLVSIELTHNVLDIEAFSIVVEKLVQVFAIKLFLVKLLATVFVNDVSLVGNCVPAVIVYASCLLINVETLVGLHQDRFTIRVVKVSQNLMGVEVVLFDGEEAGDFSTLVHIFSREHRLTVHVLDDVVCLGVSQVTTLVHSSPALVVLSSIFVLQNDDVTLVVTVEFSKYVVLVESS